MAMLFTVHFRGFLSIADCTSFSCGVSKWVPRSKQWFKWWVRSLGERKTIKGSTWNPARTKSSLTPAVVFQVGTVQSRVFIPRHRTAELLPPTVRHDHAELHRKVLSAVWWLHDKYLQAWSARTAIGFRVINDGILPPQCSSAARYTCLSCTSGSDQWLRYQAGWADH